MSDTIWAGIVGGIAGIITGGISSVVAPWANWRIENNREKLNQKRQLVARWRDMCGAVLQDCEDNHDKGYYWHRIEMHPTFTSFRPHLSSATHREMKQYEQPKDCHLFLVKKIGEIEKKWELL